MRSYRPPRATVSSRPAGGSPPPSGERRPPDEPLSLTVAADHPEAAVVAVGDLDVASAELLEREVRELQRSGFEDIVIDLRGVTFLDSRGLRVLLGLRNDAKRNDHRLALVPGPVTVQRIFRLTATHGLFDWDEA